MTCKFCDRYPVATYLFFPGLSYVFRKLQKVVLFDFFGLTNGCNTCVHRSFFPHWSQLGSEMMLHLIFANWSPACRDLGPTAFSLLKYILNSIHKQQHGRGEQRIDHKVIFLMASSPISVNRVAPISKEGEFPHFVYSCSKMQLEKQSLIAVSAHSVPLSPRASWAGFTLQAMQVLLPCVPIPNKAGLFLWDILV